MLNNRISGVRAGRPHMVGMAMALAVLLPKTAFAEAAEAPAASTQPSGADDIGDIVVTARKKSETLLESPVVIQAFSQQKLQSLGVVDTVGLAAITPGLRLNYGTGGVGATAFLRGIGNGDSATFIDQSVLLNVDGVPLTQGAFYKSGLFDIAQVEVLKGPQSLYFGKSASAGIISVTTADPTSTWDSMVKGGYGFNFHEKRFEGFVSGPLSHDLGVRVAAFYDDSRGYLHNLNPDSTTAHVPDGDEIGARATLKYDNHDDFRVRAKYTFYRSRFLGDLAGDNQYICAGSIPQKSIEIPYDDCTVNDTTRGNPSPGVYDPVNNYVTVPGLIGKSPSPYDNGKTYSNTDTHQASLQMDYDLADRNGSSRRSTSGAWSMSPGGSRRTISRRNSASPATGRAPSTSWPASSTGAEPISSIPRSAIRRCRICRPSAFSARTMSATGCGCVTKRCRDSRRPR